MSCHRVALLLVILVTSQGVYTQNPWLMGVRTLLEDCPVKSAKVERDLTPSVGFVRALSNCARRRALLAIDDLLQDDVIPIVEGLEFVKYRYAVDDKVDNNTVTFNIRFGALISFIQFVVRVRVFGDSGK